MTQGLGGSTARSRRTGVCNNVPQYGRARMRAALLVSRYNFCIAKGKAALCRDTTLNMAAIRHPAPCNIAQQSAHGDTTAARDTARSTEHDATCDTASAHCNTAGGGPRHGAQRSAWEQCAQPGSLGCAPCVLDPVLTQCTILSHCLDHCSWTLFMNTVHGVFKKK